MIKKERNEIKKKENENKRKDIIKVKDNSVITFKRLNVFYV